MQLFVKYGPELANSTEKISPRALFFHQSSILEFK